MFHGSGYQKNNAVPFEKNANISVFIKNAKHNIETIKCILQQITL